MSITFGGLASGLDTNAIITQLVALERRPIQILQGKKAEQQSRLELIGEFEGLVKDLRSKAQELGNFGGFYAWDLQVGTAGVADFQVTGEADAAGHTLKVFSLAAADRYGYDAVADPSASLGAGTITFDYYDDDTAALKSYSVDIQAGTDSLEDIAAALNSQAGEAVSASVINTGTTANPSYELVVTGKQTGADYAIQNLTSSVAGLTGQTQINTATNAAIEIDGLRVERSTNLFNDVLRGVSFTVTQAAPEPDGAETTFTVEANTSGIKKNIQELVDSYNAVIEFINEQQTYSEESGAGGLLFGDNALRTVRSTIQDAMFGLSQDEIATLSDPLQNDGFVALSQVGISFDSSGKMKLDDADLEAAMQTDLSKFADLLIKDDGDGVRSDDDGALVKLDYALKDLLEDKIAKDDAGNPILVKGEEFQVEGLFNRRRDTLKSLIADIDKDIDRLELGVEKFEENLILQYSRLEELMGRLNAQSAYLNSGAAFPS